MKKTLTFANLAGGVAALALMMTPGAAHATTLGCFPTTVSGPGYALTMPCGWERHQMTATDDRIDGMSFTTSMAGRDYVFAWADYRRPASDYSAWRNHVREQAPKILAERNVTINGTEGYALSAQGEDGRIGLYYAFIRGNRMYALVVYNAGDSPYSKEILNFLYSLHLQ